jgi:hypothetical protein
VRSPIPTRLVTLIVLSVGVPIGLSACSSGSTAGGTTTTDATATQSSKSICSVVTPGDIQATLGTAVGEPIVRNGPTITTCTYPAADGSKSVLLSFRIDVSTTEAAEEQTAAKKLHATTQNVSGVGDGAFSYTLQQGGHTVTALVTLVGENQFAVTSTGSLDQEERLTTDIFASLAAGATSTTTAPTGSTTSTTAAG